MDAFGEQFFGLTKNRYDSSDLSDRLSYDFTPKILLVLSLTLMAKNYVGNPVQCWFPAQFTDTWEAYAETYCYVKSTYYVPLNRFIPNSFAQRRNEELNYYQWVPIILMAQAFLFLVPEFCWRSLSEKSGLNVKSVLTAAAGIKKNIASDFRNEQVERAAVHFKESLDMQKCLKPTGRFCGCLFYGSHYGNYVSVLYLLVKLLYVLNLLAQFLIINSFLGTNYTFWGYEILRDLANGREWQESGHFPRVTMCDFKVRVLGNIHNWTVQCVLMINMFNEKIYLFLWWWFLFILVLSVLSLIYWSFCTLLAGQKRGFVEKYLRIYGVLESPKSPLETRELTRFVHENLRSDGVFMIRMIQTNGGDLLTGDMVEALWKLFRGQKAIEPAKVGDLTDQAEPLPAKQAS